MVTSSHSQVKGKVWEKKAESVRSSPMSGRREWPHDPPLAKSARMAWPRVNFQEVFRDIFLGEGPGHLASTG